MKNVPAKFSPVELTRERLQFLYGDLRFEKKDLQKLTGSSRSSIDAVIKSAGMKQGRYTHRGLTRRDFTELEQCLYLPVKSGMGVPIFTQYQVAILSKAMSGELDWTAFDRFIAELPARQDQEVQDGEEREKARRYRDAHPPIVVRLMVQRSSDGLYLAEHTKLAELSLITGQVERSPSSTETIATAARRILQAEAGLDATLSDVSDIIAQQDNEGLFYSEATVEMKLVTETSPLNSSHEWHWVERSRILGV